MRKTGLVLALMVGFVGASVTWAGDNCAGLMPRPSKTKQVESCTYVHVPYSLFTYDAGQLRVSWPVSYHVHDAVIVADGAIVSSYEPGSTVALTFDPTKRYYEVRAYANLPGRGGRIKILSPIWERSVGLAGARVAADGPDIDLRSAATVISPQDEVTPTSCQLTESVNCEGGGIVSVSSDGDNGTCSGCSTDTMACCTSRTRKVFTIEGGTVTTTTETRKEKLCPELPPPGNPKEPVR